MKKQIHQATLATLITVIVSIFAGCAGVHYDKLSPTNDTVVKKNYGIPFYEAKPFILVQYHIDDKGRRTATPSLITLPDKTKPYKARIKGIFGYASVTINLSNGVLVSTVADFKTDDTLAGLMGAIGTAAKVPAEIEGLEAAAKVAKLSADNADCSSKVTGKWWALMSQAEDLVKRIKISNETDTQKALKNDILNAMIVWKKSFCEDEAANFVKSEPNEAERILSFQSSIEKFKKAASEINKKIVKYSKILGCGEIMEGSCLTLQKAKAHVEMIIEQFEKYLPQQPELPPFELYEIQYNESGVFQGLKKCFPVNES